MAEIKYRCKKENCKHEFIGDAYALKCPKCSCNEIEKIGKDKNGNWLKELIDKLKTNRKTQIIALIIIIIVFLLAKTCSKSSDNSKYSVKPIYIEEEGCIEVNIIKYSKDKTKGDTVNNLIPNFNFKITDIDGTPLFFDDVDKNRIYLCKPGLISIIWHPNKYLLKNPKDTIWTEPNPLKKGPNKNKPCPTEFKITSAEPDNNNCQMLVTTSLDTIKSRPVMISIHGRGGPYLKSNRQDAKGITKIDVWAYEEKIDTNLKNPIPFYEKNGIPIPKIGGCTTCTDKDLQAIKDNFVIAANNYVNKPDDRYLIKIFSDLILSNDAKIKLDKKIVKGGMSEIKNKFYKDFNNLHPINYMLDEKSIVLDKKSCMIVEFGFITK